MTATNDKGAEILPGSVVVDALERARECLAEARWVAQHGRNLQVEAATMLDVDDVQRQRPVPSPGPVYGPPAPDVDSGEQSALDL